MTITLVIILFLTLLYGVGLYQIRDWRDHIIKKGKHYQSWPWEHLLLTTTDTLVFDVIFMKGYSYTLPKGNQKDINKLYGLAWGLKGPQFNSVRVGWKWNEDLNKIDLLMYVHDGSPNFYYTPLGSILPGEQVTLRFQIRSKVVTISLERKSGNTSAVYSYRSPIWKVKYRCLPYFGGECAAQNDVKILIKEK